MNRTLTTVMALLTIILLGSTTAFAQAAPAVVNSEDIPITIPWHGVIIAVSLAIGFLVGWLARGARKTIVRSAGMILLALAIPGLAHAQEAQLPSIPGATQQTPTPQTPSAPPVLNPTPTPQTPTPTVTPDRSNETRNLQTISEKDAEITKLKSGNNGQITLGVILALIVGLFAGWLIFGRRQQAAPHAAPDHGDRHDPPAAAQPAPAAAPAPAADTPAPAAAATVVVAAAPATPAPAAEPAASTPTGGARTVTAILLAALAIPAFANAQTPPNAPITKVSPQIVKNGATTKVTVTTSAACNAPQVTFAAGITTKNIQTANSGFSMDLEVTPVKTEGVTRWLVSCNGTMMAAPAEASIYVLGNHLSQYIDEQVKAGVVSGLKNVQAVDNVARTAAKLAQTAANTANSEVTKLRDEQKSFAGKSSVDQISRDLAALARSVNERTAADNTNFGILTEGFKRLDRNDEVTAARINQTNETLQSVGEVVGQVAETSKTGGFLGIGRHKTVPGDAVEAMRLKLEALGQQ